jgi:hypothetical protein
MNESRLGKKVTEYEARNKHHSERKIGNKY